MVKNGASLEQMRYASKSQKQLNNVSKPAFQEDAYNTRPTRNYKPLQYKNM